MLRILAGVLTAIGAAAAAPANMPATTRPRPDLSTPRAAALAYVEASFGGAFDEIREVATGSDYAFKMLKANLEAEPALAEMNEALRARFGDDPAEGRPFPPEVRLARYRKQLAEAPVAIEGDRATVGGENGIVVRLKNVDGQWRKDLSDVFGEADTTSDGGELNQAQTRAAIAREIARRIRAGDFAGADEAKDEFDEAIWAARKNPAAGLRRAAPVTIPAGADVPELLAQLIDERKVSERKRIAIHKHLMALPPEQTVPAVVDAISRLPEDKKSKWITGPTQVLCDLLSAIAKKGPREAADKALVAAWPKANTDFARRRLLIEYREHSIVESEPLARSIYEDLKTSAGMREWAAMALLRVRYERYRERVLLDLDRDPTWGSFILEGFLEPSGRRPVDPLVVSVAMRQIQAALASAQDRTATAGCLADLVGRYTGERNGLPDPMRAALTPFAGRMSNQEYYKGEIKRCLEWWDKNKGRFEPEAEKRRAATRPATAPAAP